MIPKESASDPFRVPGDALTPRPLRSHQKHLTGVIEAIVGGQTDARDILAAVTPGGGKSLLPVIAAARLIAAGIDRVLEERSPRRFAAAEARAAGRGDVWAV